MSEREHEAGRAPGRASEVWALVRDAFKEWSADDASSLSAALAYYTLISIVPLFLIVIAIVGLIFGEEAARGHLFEQLSTILGEDLASSVQKAVKAAGENQGGSGTIASVISIAVLLFGATQVFAQLQLALNRIWNVTEREDAGLWSIIRTRILSAGMILVVGFLLLVSLILSAGLSVLSRYMSDLIPGSDAIWSATNQIVSFLVITLLFAAIYKIVPDAKIAWRDTWIGAILTSALFAIGKYALGLYLSRAGFESSWGAGGSLVAALVWIYYSSQIVFFGAELTQVWALRYGTRIQPDEHARWRKEGHPLAQSDRRRDQIADPAAPR